MHVGRDHGAPEDLGPTTRAPQHLTEVICRRRESWHHRCTMCIDRCAIRKVANKYWSDYLDAEGVSGPLDVTMRSHLPAPVEKMAVRAGARMRPFFSDDDTIGYYKRVERVYGSFYRRFTLPDSADTTNISAKSTHGVLTITIPKTEKVQPRKISVEAD